MTALAQRLGAQLPYAVQQVVVVAAALAVGAIILEASGYDAGDVYLALARSVTDDIGGTVRWMTPLVLTGLGTAVAFRARIWNIGLDGQLYIGAIAAAATGLALPRVLPGAPAIALVLAAAVFGGALWAALAGVLRIWWGAPELITTILLIQVATLLTDYLVLGPIKGTGDNAATLSTNDVPERTWLPTIISGSTANVGFYVALGAALVLAFVVFRTTFGYELKMFGGNPSFSAYGGIDNARVFLTTIALSGALGGLAGGLEVLGVLHRFLADFNPDLGFAGIVVALLARNNPLAVVPAAFFFGALRTGGINIERFTDTPRDVGDIVSALIVLGVTARVGLGASRRWRAARRRVRREEREPPLPTVDEAERAVVGDTETV